MYIYMYTGALGNLTAHMFCMCPMQWVHAASLCCTKCAHTEPAISPMLPTCPLLHNSYCLTSIKLPEAIITNAPHLLLRFLLAPERHALLLVSCLPLPPFAAPGSL